MHEQNPPVHERDQPLLKRYLLDPKCYQKVEGYGVGAPQQDQDLRNAAAAEGTILRALGQAGGQVRGRQTVVFGPDYPLRRAVLVLHGARVRDPGRLAARAGPGSQSPRSRALARRRAPGHGRPAAPPAPPAVCGRARVSRHPAQAGGLEARRPLRLLRRPRQADLTVLRVAQRRGTSHARGLQQHLREKLAPRQALQSLGGRQTAGSLQRSCDL